MKNFRASQRFKPLGVNSELEKLALAGFRKCFSDLDDLLTQTAATVNPRYQALARTHLEIAAMFATKMISHSKVD